MWATLTDHIGPLIGLITAIAGLIAAWLKLRPRRVVGWLSAVKERETLAAMLENEKAWGLYWREQAQQCLSRFQEEFQQEAHAERAAASRAGTGRTSSNGEDGPIRMERWTG